VPAIDTDDRPLADAIQVGAEDLGSLRVFDPEFPERAVVAAGAPWYLALYGRDALLTAWMALIVDPDLALGVLETLARFQGEDVDPRTEEEPGRILHRMRFGPGAFSAGPDSVSYGSVDATPLFVMLLGEMRRWGLAPEVVDRLLPHADRALAWIESHGDRDGDGYVEYERASDRGPANQSWKDTDGAICSIDGRPALAPVAPCEVQGYVYAAYLARAHFASEAADVATAERYRAKAAALKTAFNRDYWVDEHGWLAMALDADKQPVDALASNVGHCLWTGILDEDRAEVVAKQLLSPELFSGWGVRTLSSGARSYNPIGAHTGAIWPHDNAIIAAGLMRYGFVDEAHRVISAQLEASALHGGRLPMLCGFDRDEIDAPVPYPEACTTRASSAAAPLMFLRVLLRIDPWVPYGKLWLDPALPSSISRLRVERIPLLGGRVTVDVDGDSWTVSDLPPAVELIRQPRAPLTAAVP
jgi:glycogen debranching enzyme